LASFGKITSVRSACDSATVRLTTRSLIPSF
jgi:hypothetical protein